MGAAGGQANLLDRTALPTLQRRVGIGVVVSGAPQADSLVRASLCTDLLTSGSSWLLSWPAPAPHVSTAGGLPPASTGPISTPLPAGPIGGDYLDALADTLPVGEGTPSRSVGVLGEARVGLGEDASVLGTLRALPQWTGSVSGQCPVQWPNVYRHVCRCRSQRHPSALRERGRHQRVSRTECVCG